MRCRPLCCVWRWKDHSVWLYWTVPVSLLSLLQGWERKKDWPCVFSDSQRAVSSACVHTHNAHAHAHTVATVTLVDPPPLRGSQGSFWLMCTGLWLTNSCYRWKVWREVRLLREAPSGPRAATGHVSAGRAQHSRHCWVMLKLQTAVITVRHRPAPSFLFFSFLFSSFPMVHGKSVLW